MNTTPDPEELHDRFLDALLENPRLRPEEFLGVAEVDPAVRARMEALSAAIRREAALAEDDPRGGSPTAQVPGKGTILGDYRLLEPLGEGGMGVVYLAEQCSLGRRVALKLLRPELASSPVARARFDREARALARLRHPHIVKCFAFGEQDGLHFLVMELDEGRGLDDLLREAADSGEPLPVVRALEWMAQIADGLDVTHRAGLVHRDVKPANLRITPEGRALLVDFGVARDLEADTPTLTRSFLGTPTYMAPEQIASRGGRIDGRTDVYSLGVCLYECVTRTVPFRGDTVESLFHQILDRDPPPPREVCPSLSRDLETVILRAMAKDPAHRYADAAGFRDDLRALLEFRPIQARRASPWQRVRAAARRRPLRFAALSALLLSLGVLGAVQVVDGQLERQRQMEQRQESWKATQQAIQDYGADIGATRALEAGILRLQRRRVADYMTDEEHRTLDAQIDAVVQSRTRREQSFHAILEQLRVAETLGVDSLEVREMTGRLYLARLEEVSAEQDPVQREVYRDLVLEHDPRGVLRQELSGSVPLTLQVDVDGAEVHLFRLVDANQVREGAPRRRVAIPLHTETGGEWDAVVPPDTVCLEVLEGQGEVQRGDLIVEIGGHPVDSSVLVVEGEGEVLELDRLVEIGGEPVLGWYEVAAWGLERSYLPRTSPSRPVEYVFASEEEQVRSEAKSLEELGVVVATPAELAERGDCPATTVQNGALRSVTLPPGLRVRSTAAPWVVGPDSRVGRTPIDPFFLPAGSYGLLVTAPGLPPLRTVLHLPNDSDPEGLPVQLHAPTVPEGFVRVSHPRRRESPKVPYCMQRFETTFGEYLEFLNDAGVQAEIQRSTVPIRVPRGGQGQRSSHVLRDPSGSYRLQPGWPADLPVFGISWQDAAAYARWRTRRAEEQGLPYLFALPTHDQWTRSADTMTEYPFGERFHPRWVGSAYSRPRPFPFRVGSFPVDESFLGVMDLSGNLSEWLVDWWLEDRGHRRHAGGSWGIGGPESIFGIQGGSGTPEDAVSDTIGFRLVVTWAGDGR